VIESIFAISDDVRYVAIYKDGQLTTQSKSDTCSASGAELDRYAELFINPVLLKAAS